MAILAHAGIEEPPVPSRFGHRPLSTSPAETALEAIRATELELARQLEDARSEADAAVADARRDARRIVREARVRGATEAERRYEERVAEALAEAERVEMEAAARVEHWLDIIRPRLAVLVDQMLDRVLSTQVEGDR